MFKRIVEYMKTLFDVDMRLRKWCLDKAIDSMGVSDEMAIAKAKAFYNYLKAKN